MVNSRVKVYVGMSGGVDSSVTAALLKRQGYQVTGVYMKNWTTDLPGFICPWAEDLADAKRVAVQLDIPFKVFDFQREYKQHVVGYMIREYQAGRTPNPDIMCNQEIKFELFLRAALADGANMIATGHYARVSLGLSSTFSSPPALASTAIATSSPGLDAVADREVDERPDSDIAGANKSDRRRQASLLTGLDKGKDQSYFLYRVTAEALGRTLLPIGELTKTEVREVARQLGLVTADKKDSQGICFVGKVGIKEFLQNYVHAEPGDIIDTQTNSVVGQHDGAIFYTIGQRHGLHVGGGRPFYVTGKDMAKNIVYVTTNLNDEKLWQSALMLTQLHWIDTAPDITKSYQVRTRYRAPLVSCRIESVADQLRVIMDEPERAIAAGQSAVLYDGDHVLGGGIVV